LNPIKHIAIAGNIGAGKTTLAQQLSEQLGWIPHYESTEDNPYLSDFYHDMKRWSFNLQIYFLNSRFNQIIEIQNGTVPIVQDRTIYEDAYIFAPNLYEMGLMTERDFKNYQSLFGLMSSFIKPPDILIYLRANIQTLVAHIEERGRSYEGTISIDYLKKLNQRYENWIEDYKHGELLIIDVNTLDFKKNKEDLGLVLEQVSSKIHGLF
jgi:deoxyadenosine/deoxycytidine kinase